MSSWENMNRKIFYNGRIYTSDSSNPIASAIVIEDEKYLYVGTDEEALNYGMGIDLKGKCIIPGMVDSHCHILSGAFQAEMDMIFVSQETQPDELETVIHAKLEEMNLFNSNEKIRVMGIDYTIKGFDSDSIGKSFENREVYVFSFDGHAMLLNKKALEVCGIDSNIKDPSKDSFYGRDEDGNINGWIVELEAMKRCEEFFSSKVGNKAKNAFYGIQDNYTKRGYTTVFDAASLQGKEILVSIVNDVYKEKGYLNLRIGTCVVYQDIESTKDTIDMLIKIKKDMSSEYVYVNTIKMIADGTIEEHTAHLQQPYDDEEDNVGVGFISCEQIMDMSELAIKNGISVHVHAIGDKAVKDTLKAFDNIGVYNNEATLTIAHNQLYDEESMELLGKLSRKNNGIFFQTTPQWIMEDDYTEKYIGKERYDNEFPFKEALKRGAYVTFGGDTSDEEFFENPFVGMYYAISRDNENEKSLSRQEALEAYTINGAKQLGIQEQCGSITSGKDADFVVISEDLFNIPVDEVKNITVKESFFKGRQIYKA